MTNTKSTKRALFSSVVALILCFSMLLGTTFAWFTDSVTSGANVIQAGTLDVDLYMWKGAVTDDTNRVEITNESTPIFGGAGSLAAQNDPANTLWEPGKTQVVYLSIANNGSLDLKYKVAIEVYDVKNNLIDVLEYAITPDATWNETPVAWNGGEKVVRGTNVAANDVTLKAKEEHFFALSVHMLEGAGNEYQAGNAYFNIKLLATQLGSESDSFGNGYDAGATYPNVSAPTPLDTEAKTQGVTLKTDVVTVKVPADVVVDLPATVESLSLTYESSVNNFGASVFENVDLVDQDGNIVDLEALGNNEEITVTLTLPDGHGFNEGDSVLIYHDGELITAAEVTADGTITYGTTHFCMIEVKPGYIVDSADKLVNAINNSKDNSVIIIEEGDYTFASQLTINNKSLDIIGLGEVNLISKGGANTHVFQLRNGAENSVAKDGMVVTIKNVNIDGNYKSAIMVRNDLDLYLENVTFAGTYNWSTLQVENSYDNESKFDGIVNIYAKNVTSEKVTMAADDGRTTYFNYEDCTFGLIEVQNLGGKVIVNEIKAPTPGAIYWVKNVTELQSALDKAVGATTIFLTEDISGDVIVKQKEGVDITIDGNGCNYKGLIEIYGAARSAGAETLTIKNVNFFTDKYMPSDEAFIFCNTTESAKRYAHNVTVDGCTFIADGEGENSAVGLRMRQCYNITVKNSTFTDMHSAMWATGGNGMTFDNVTIANCKNGISFGTADKLVVNNCTINAVGDYGYGIRCDASGAYTLSAEGNTITADAPILLRKATGKFKAVLTNNTFTGKGNAVIATASDYEEGKELTPATGELTIIIDGAVIAANTAQLIQAIKNAPVGVGEVTTILLADGTYDGDIKITLADLGVQGGDVVIKAMDGAKPVISGTVVLGYRNQGVGATMYNANVTFDGITFNHNTDNNHSLDIQDVKSLNLINCTIIGNGEYGITSARGNATGKSKIAGCTFENAGMQLLGNFATGLVIDGCIFNESCVNVQAGNSVTVQNCQFNKTLKASNVNDSFYAIRSNSTPITVKNCNIDIDSELTEVATAQAKWYLLANRGTTDWTVENVAVTLTEAAAKQDALAITACTSTGKINTTGLTVNGVAK